MTKKLIRILIVLLLVAPLSLAQEVHYANQISVAWNPVVDSGAISYQVYISPYPVVDPLDPDAHMLVSETTSTQAVVTFSGEGKFAIGVRTKKEFEGETLYSDINWSFENGESTPNPFIVGRYLPPDAVLNLRVE